MLAVLEQAQAAGQKAQQDALIGQGSIFDLGPSDGGARPAARPALGGPSHAPIPGEEFSRSELLAAEKESIGLFISEHPLKEVGAALRARCDSSLAELAARRDGDWVTVGGMVTQAKRIKTKKGDWMMFATLYDLDASVEIIVFDKALAASEDALATDSIVLVRGKVDHKDRDKTCLVAQQVERFEPSREEVLEAQAQAAKQAGAPPSALRLRLDATALPATALGELKDVLAGLPGRVRRGDRAHHLDRSPLPEARAELPGRRGARACTPSSTSCSAPRCSTVPRRRRPRRALRSPDACARRRSGRPMPARGLCSA